LARAIGRADTAADPARQRARDLTDETEVVPDPHRGVEVDHLHLRELLEPPHPPEHVVVADRETLALDELNHGAALEIDGGDEHRIKPPSNHENHESTKATKSFNHHNPMPRCPAMKSQKRFRGFRDLWV